MPAGEYIIPEMEFRRTLKTLYWALVLIETTFASLEQHHCEEDNDCGWNVQCSSSHQCVCLPGFTFSSNNEDCIDTYCDDPKCLDCSYNKGECRHCIGFVEEDTGVCVDSCQNYKFYVEGSQIGRVCAAKPDVWTSIYVAIIVGVIAGVLLICVVALACYWKLKSDKERKLRFEMLNKQMTMENKSHIQKDVSQYISFENPAYVSDSLSSSGRGTQLNMLQNIATLRREMDTVIQMYTEARSALQRLDKHSRLWNKYRNISHGLGKVIGLLRQSKPEYDDPELGGEAPALFEWAVALLCDYKNLKQVTELQSMGGYSPGAHSVTPGSSLTRLTSAFQSDHFLSNGHLPGDVSPSTTTRSFTYERVPGRLSTFQKEMREVGEISFINLQDDYTEPVDV